MRLTLRTLLAYLEDELKPAESKEIGQKIAESPVATSLAQRIREVMRRRRLSAEDLNETGLDPNLVAEYLDGSLSPQEVADVEKVCLGSDAHLAEVAACHQILTIVLGEPIEISESSREKMYALADDGTVAKSDIPYPASSAQAAPHAVEATPFPMELRRKSFWQSSGPLLIPLALIGIWLILIRFDPSLNFFAAAPDESGERLEVAVLEDEEVDMTGEIPVVVPRQDEEPEPVEMAEKPGLSTAGIDPEPPPDMAEATVTAANDSAPQESTTSEPEEITSAAPSTKVAETETKPAEPAPESSAPQVVGRYRSAEGILLSFNESRNGWYTVPYELNLLEETLFAVPVPFSATVELEQDAPTLMLLGGTRGRLTTESPAAPLGLELEEGRLLLESLGPQAKPFALQTESLSWRIVLIEPGTRVGIELEPLRVSGYEQPLPPLHFRLRLLVSIGSARLASELGQVTVSEGEHIILRDPLSTTQVQKNPNDPPTPEREPGMLKPEMVQPYGLTPNWMVPEDQNISTIQLLYIDKFAGYFKPELPAQENLEILIEDQRPQMAQYSVICQGLIDNVRDLLKIMRVSEFQDARLAAANELRLWLPRHPEMKDQYLTRLELAFPGDDSAQLDRLLWGYTRDDARDPIISRRLIDLLTHDREVVSELAFLEVARLTGLDDGLKALISPTQRRAWTNRWERQVRDRGSILPPDEADEELN